MKSPEKWKPTKFICKNGELRANRDRSKVAVASRLIVDLIAREYTKLIPKYCRGDLLDLGCGHVPMYDFYRGHVDSTTCVDWAESLHQNEFLDLVHDLTKPIPLASEEFDTIICSDVLEHIPNPPDLWQEMTRLLKPGGMLILNVPFLYCVHEAPFDFHRYTEFALRKYAESNGLTIELLESHGGAISIVTDTSAKALMRLPVVGSPLASFVQSVCYGLYRRGIEYNSKRFPLFYTLVARK